MASTNQSEPTGVPKILTPSSFQTSGPKSEISTGCTLPLFPTRVALNCLASVLATSRLNDVPVAMPRTPPSFFWRAVMVASTNERVTSGVSALAKSSAADTSNANVSTSSRHTRRISFVQPPRPGALPDGAVRKHFTNNLTSNWRRDSGTKFITY